MERREPPKLLLGTDNLGQVAELDVTFGKTQEKPARSTPQWKKKSILFKLPYWEFNLLRHNLDVMHIEKNVFDNSINTIMNVPSKTKDNLKSRLDLPDICDRRGYIYEGITMLG